MFVPDYGGEGHGLWALYRPGVVGLGVTYANDTSLEMRCKIKIWLGE